MGRRMCFGCRFIAKILRFSGFPLRIKKRVCIIHTPRDPKNRRVQIRKYQTPWSSRIDLLRKEPGRRPKVDNRTGSIVVAQLDTALLVLDIQSAFENTIGIGRILAPRKADPQIVAMIETVSVGQYHLEDFVGVERELFSANHHACPEDRLANMFSAELGRDQDDSGRATL